MHNGNNMERKILFYIMMLLACAYAEPMTASQSFQTPVSNGKDGKAVVKGRTRHGHDGNAGSKEKTFDKEKFRKEQEQFIAAQAHLTEKEQAQFFPVFHKMQDEERELFMALGKLKRTQANSDKEAKELIKKIDNLDLQMKQLQMKYHTKFYDVLPATKVLACLKAEEQFKRQVMERMARGKRQNNKKPTTQKTK